MNTIGDLVASMRTLVRSMRNGVLRFTSTRGGQGTVQGNTFSDETDTPEHLQDYGFASYPTAGSQGVRLVVGGDPSHTVALALGGGSRPDLAEGEVAVYHPGNGARIKFLGDGTIEGDNGNGATIKLMPDGTIEVGGNTDAVALASKSDANWTNLVTAITGAAPVAMDGGAALKTAILLALSPQAVGSAKVKVS